MLNPYKDSAFLQLLKSIFSIFGKLPGVIGITIIFWQPQTNYINLYESIFCQYEISHWDFFLRPPKSKTNKWKSFAKGFGWFQHFQNTLWPSQNLQKQLFVDSVSMDVKDKSKILHCIGMSKRCSQICQKNRDHHYSCSTYGGMKEVIGKRFINYLWVEGQHWLQLEPLTVRSQGRAGLQVLAKKWNRSKFEGSLKWCRFPGAIC